MKILMSLCAGIATLGVLSSCKSISPVKTGNYIDAEAQAAFNDTVKPLLEKRCVWCHSDEKPNAGLNFQQVASVLSANSRFIVPGNANESRVYLAVTRDAAHPAMMPGDGWGITAEQKAALKLWIDRGAPWPNGWAGKIRRRPYSVEFDDYL